MVPDSDKPLFGRLWPADVPAEGEDFDALAVRPGVRLEQIRSAPSDEPGPWYDQDWDEWVALLAGDATLEFADADADETLPEGERVRALAPGEWAWLPAGTRHRVARVGAPSVWLAVHFGPAGAEADT